MSVRMLRPSLLHQFFRLEVSICMSVAAVCLDAHGFRKSSCALKTLVTIFFIYLFF